MSGGILFPFTRIACVNRDAPTMTADTIPAPMCKRETELDNLITGGADLGKHQQQVSEGLEKEQHMDCSCS